jgi:hypothetical protein
MLGHVLCRTFFTKKKWRRALWKLPAHNVGSPTSLCGPGFEPHNGYFNQIRVAQQRVVNNHLQVHFPPSHRWPKVIFWFNQLPLCSLAWLTRCQWFYHCRDGFMLQDTTSLRRILILRKTRTFRSRMGASVFRPPRLGYSSAIRYFLRS